MGFPQKLAAHILPLPAMLSVSAQYLLAQPRAPPVTPLCLSDSRLPPVSCLHSTDEHYPKPGRDDVDIRIEMVEVAEGQLHHYAQCVLGVEVGGRGEGVGGKGSSTIMQQ